MKLYEVAGNKSAEDVLEQFECQQAADYGHKLIQAFGEPDGVMYNQLYWKEGDQMKHIVLKDEQVEHSFPKEHLDFVYSSWEIEVPDHLHSLFAHVSGSIIIDGLKNLVTARCGTLHANAVTLQFVKDVIDQKAPQQFDQAKQEYANRITSGQAPQWYSNTVGD